MNFFKFSVFTIILVVTTPNMSLNASKRSRSRSPEAAAKEQNGNQAKKPKVEDQKSSSSSSSNELSPQDDWGAPADDAWGDVDDEIKEQEKKEIKKSSKKAQILSLDDDDQDRKQQESSSSSSSSFSSSSLAGEGKEEKVLAYLTSREEDEGKRFSSAVPLSCFKHFGLFTMNIKNKKRVMYEGLSREEKEKIAVDDIKIEREEQEKIAQECITSNNGFVNLSAQALKVFVQMLAFVGSRERVAMEQKVSFSSRETALQLSHDMGHHFKLVAHDLKDSIMLTDYLDAKILLTAYLIYLAKNSQPDLEKALPGHLQEFIIHERNFSTLPSSSAHEHCLKTIEDFTDNIAHPDFDFAGDYTLLPPGTDAKSFRPMVLRALTQKAQDFVEKKELSDADLKASFKRLPENWYKMKVRELYRNKNDENIDDIDIVAILDRIKSKNIRLCDMNLGISLRGIIDLLVVHNEVTPTETLNLSNSKLSGPIPPSISNLTSLGWLYLQNNELSGPIPPSIDKLGNLKKLDLSNNQISGQIPVCFGRLKNLGELNLSSNKLDGSIPAEFGDLKKSLRVLNLSSNNLSGQVPEKIGELGNISLFLSDNELIVSEILRLKLGQNWIFVIGFQRESGKNRFSSIYGGYHEFF